MKYLLELRFNIGYVNNIKVTIGLCFRGIFEQNQVFFFKFICFIENDCYLNNVKFFFEINEEYNKK